MPDVQPNLSVPDANLPDAALPDYMADLLARLKSESMRNQLQIIQELAASGEVGLDILIRFLSDPVSPAPSPINGKAMQVLRAANTPKVQAFLQSKFPDGLMSLRSERGIDYSSLQELLVRQEFQAADRLTLEKLCELAGGLAAQRKWLYFTEVEQFPVTDLQTINTLWVIYSEGKFGFSVQRELWLSTGKNWEALWSLIGWKSGNSWTRYPQEFTWNLSAPKGHLPLSNQLRGVRVIASLLSHPAWG
ncbi:GUN4 N-terminal ARM-like repeat domain-containing protein [Phormidium tenue FACHB-886]|nr:GUN4 N-terminal ARM-like repeat domain-containing protein [Phormidium tenue FACHB-886]